MEKHIPPTVWKNNTMRVYVGKTLWEQRAATLTTVRIWVEQWVNANIPFSHRASLFLVSNQQHRVICFSLSVSLLCYDNWMRYLVPKETKASPWGAAREQKQPLKRRDVGLIVIQWTETWLGIEDEGPGIPDWSHRFPAFAACLQLARM